MTEMLTEVVEEGENALVFTQFAVMGRLIADHLERELTLERLYLDGSLTAMPASGSSTATRPAPSRACWWRRCERGAPVST